METLFKRVEMFVCEEKIIEDGDRVLLAVSGGPDSMFLLHFFYYLSQKNKITVKVAYIHHHMRKKADKELLFVKKVAESYGFSFYSGDIYITGKSGVEEKGRIGRYKELCRISGDTGCNKISTGHTLDDQVETVLMHLIKGTGLAGMRGILPISAPFEDKDIVLARPLLSISKSDIVAALKREGAKYSIDSYNLSPDFFRNKIRQKIMPLLKKYNPKVREKILRTSLLVQDDFDFLKEEAKRSVEKIFIEKDETIDLNVYKGLHISIKRMVISLLVKKIKNTRYRSFVLIEKIRKRLDKLDYEFLSITDLERIINDRPIKKVFVQDFVEIDLDIPGTVVMADGTNVESDKISVSDEIFCNRERFICYLDMDKVGKKIKIRTRKIGDTFVPLGMVNRKKLSRFFIDKKVPSLDRDKYLVFVVGREIIWVCGLEISDKFKVTEGTENVVKISVRPTVKSPFI